MKTALISGISGQDGSYLAEFLIQKGYEVHGIILPSSKTPSSIHPIFNLVTQHVGDVTDWEFIHNLFRNNTFNEIYHLATQHEVGLSLSEYLETRKIETDSTMIFLSLMAEFQPKTRFFYASSSNVFGSALTSPQSEETPFMPNSFYSIAKVSSMNLVRLYRSNKDIFACSGILFNHESPRRDRFFLTRKITSTAARIKLKLDHELVLGDLTSKRDWGFAGDYVEAMWLMLQAAEPLDFVIGTGQSHSVQDVLDIAFGYFDLDWRQFVKTNPALMRSPVEKEIVADISLIKRKLGWAPKTSFQDLIRLMAVDDLSYYKGNLK